MIDLTKLQRFQRRLDRSLIRAESQLRKLRWLEHRGRAELTTPRGLHTALRQNSWRRVH